MKTISSRLMIVAPLLLAMSGLGGCAVFTYKTQKDFTIDRPDGGKIQVTHAATMNPFGMDMATTVTSSCEPGKNPTDKKAPSGPCDTAVNDFSESGFAKVAAMPAAVVAGAAVLRPAKTNVSNSQGQSQQQQTKTETNVPPSAKCEGECTGMTVGSGNSPAVNSNNPVYENKTIGSFNNENKTVTIDSNNYENKIVDSYNNENKTIDSFNSQYTNKNEYETNYNNSFNSSSKVNNTTNTTIDNDSHDTTVIQSGGKPNNHGGKG